MGDGKDEPKEMTAAEGVAYIKDALINGKLIMAEATVATQWSFPRIRSRAQTICKELGGAFEKEKRGVYFCNPTAEVEQAVKDVEKELKGDDVPLNPDALIEEAPPNMSMEEIEHAVMAHTLGKVKDNESDESR